MDIESYKKFKLYNRELEELLENVVQTLEEDRYYPSVREAGTAPTESATENCYNYISDFVSKWVDDKSWMTTPTFEDLLIIVTSDNVEEFDELKEIDSFVNDNGERKYRYDNVVYLHKPSGRYLIVETQNDPKYEWPGVHFQTYEGHKKEKIIYTWE